MTRQSVCAAVAAISLFGSAAAAQHLPPGCNPKLAKPTGQRMSKEDIYKPRGTPTRQWCEGFYQQEVGNPEMRIAAMTIPATPLDTKHLRSIDSLVVEWEAPPGAVVHLSARQINDPTLSFYQLDADIPTGTDGEGRWAWPTLLLQKYNTWPLPTRVPRTSRPADPKIWVQASTRFAPDTNLVYVPVRVATPTDAGRVRNRIDVDLIPPEAVTLANVTLAPWLSSGATKPPLPLDPNCPRPRGGEMGGDMVRVTLCMPQKAETGLFVLTVGATPRSKIVRFYYAAPKASPSGKPH